MNSRPDIAIVALETNDAPSLPRVPSPIPLRSSLRQGREVGDLLAAAKDGALRDATLTQRLLAFSRQLPLEPRVLQLNRIVTDTSELLRRTLGEHVQLETVLAGGLWAVCNDQSQLENAIVNLAINARDASARSA